MMTSAQVVETSVAVTDNSTFHDYPHPYDRTTRSTKLRTLDMRVTDAVLYQMRYEATDWGRGQLLSFNSTETNKY